MLTQNGPIMWLEREREKNTWLTLRGLGGRPDIGGMHSIGAPIQVYPLYENAFRAHRGQTPRANDDESAALYAGFAKVAAQHPFAWNYGKPPATKEEIQSVSRRNRMICSPCEPTTQRRRGLPRSVPHEVSGSMG